MVGKQTASGWEWTDQVDASHMTLEHVGMAYKLNTKRCKPFSCKRNCTQNPYCLCGLGEKSWFEDSTPKEETDDDECNKVREPGTFVGLRNLGATCYVNSFLQLWYHNHAFRHALYSWKPVIPRTENGPFEPQDSVSHLQVLFALMQYGERTCINPYGFIESLGLDAMMQQDAQEFAKLFISMLEERLSSYPDPSVSSMIQQQFRGTYVYVTKCGFCGTESFRPSQFYELDLSLGQKGTRTILDTLREFLEEEKMEGTEQYFCSFCQTKRNAKRVIQLKSLPPVLNVQLLRFVFDRKTGHKRKVNSVVQFPEVLDMTPYMTKNGKPAKEESCLYDLQAVLIHKGSSAYSGHYVAHICDMTSGDWYQFNDEQVQKLEGKKLKLGSEEDVLTSTKKTRVEKTPKGFHSSNNAYMLVYLRRAVGQVKESYTWELPDYLQETILYENSKFQEWQRHQIEIQDAKRSGMIQMKKDVQSLYAMLPVREGEPFEFVSTKWLSNWLARRDASKPLSAIDNYQLLCNHGKVYPDCVKMYKCISLAGADKLYGQFGGGPRLTEAESLCWDCVKAKCDFCRSTARLNEDAKAVVAQSKLKLETNQDCFWVGKESLRGWKRLVSGCLEEQLESQCSRRQDSNGQACNGWAENGSNDQMDTGIETSEESAHLKKPTDETTAMDCNADLEGGEVPPKKAKLDESSVSNEESSKEDSVGFNEDLLCIHNQLCWEENMRKLVPAATWAIFTRYFPNAPTFPSTATSCRACQSAACEEAEVKFRNKQLALEHKTILADLYKGRNRPSWDNANLDMVYVLGKDFVNSWRAFVRDPTRRDPVIAVSCAALLCTHGSLLHRPESTLQNDAPLVMLWPSEWEALLKLLPIEGTTVSIKRVTNELGVTFVSEPGVCESCLQDKEESENQEKLFYDNAVIYVRQITSGNDDPSDVDAQQQPDLADTKKSPMMVDDDVEFVAEKKKQKVETNATVAPTAASFRRSQRQRNTRGMKQVVVSCDTTVRQLKIDLLGKFSVAPYDQHLSFEGKALADNDASLASFGIMPGSVILLQADEPCDAPLLEDFSNAVPEEGFKGTELMGK